MIQLWASITAELHQILIPMHLFHLLTTQSTLTVWAYHIILVNLFKWMHQQIIVYEFTPQNESSILLLFVLPDSYTPMRTMLTNLSSLAFFSDS